MNQTQVYTPTQLTEAYQILREHGTDIKILAGGTDLMVLFNMGQPLPHQVLNIWQLNELRTIINHGDYLQIGALCSYTQLIQDPLIRAFAPQLVAASATIGAAQIQNRGTLGGNIANGSPAGDSLPVLAAFDAQIEIGSLTGTRVVPFTQFYQGYRKTVLASDEMVLSIILNKQLATEQAAFYKVGTRAAQAISKVMCCVRATIDSDRRINQIAIALGSVAPTVIRATQTEQLLTGATIDDALIAQARNSLSSEVRPIDDVRSNAHYRRVVAGNLIAKFLREA